jgi:hypothetical protein
MAEKEQTKSSKKKLVSYAIFFVISFLITFSVVYVAIRGFKNPFQKKPSAADSTAVVDKAKVPQDTVKNLSKPKEEEKPKELQPDKDNKVGINQLIGNENEVKNLQLQVALLKNANERYLKQLASKKPFADSLNQTRDTLKVTQQRIKTKEDDIAKLDSTLRNIKKVMLGSDSSSMAMFTDSLKKMITKLKQEKVNNVNKIEELNKLQNKITQLQTELKNEANKTKIDAKELSKVYDAMKPTNAAEIMAVMDDNLVVEILKNLKKRQAAKILAALPPKRAAIISKTMH